MNIGQGKAGVSGAELLFNIADAYEVSGRFEETVDYYLKVPAQHPDQVVWVVKAYLRVAKIFEDRKDWEGAAVTYQKIIQLKTEESKYAQERLDWIKKR
ncbi:MAG: tetratricopeptide repeat protein [Candidatus Omnitrophica bacterium]|nr:tetratricopeptide repeat protein [Candidatus Omnitrophota bacterium]